MGDGSFMVGLGPHPEVSPVGGNEASDVRAWMKAMCNSPHQSFPGMRARGLAELTGVHAAAVPDIRMRRPRFERHEPHRVAAGLAGPDQL